MSGMHPGSCLRRCIAKGPEQGHRTIDRSRHLEPIRVRADSPKAPKSLGSRPEADHYADGGNERCTQPDSAELAQTACHTQRNRSTHRSGGSFRMSVAYPTAPTRTCAPRNRNCVFVRPECSPMLHRTNGTRADWLCDPEYVQSDGDSTLYGSARCNTSMVCVHLDVCVEI